LKAQNSPKLLGDLIKFFCLNLASWIRSVKQRTGYVQQILLLAMLQISSPTFVEMASGHLLMKDIVVWLYPDAMQLVLLLTLTSVKNK
jgi:hypothetical protein